MIGLPGIYRHRRLRNLLSSYMDGQVSAREARQVDEHLSSCDECRQELETLKATVDLLMGLPELDVPRSFALNRQPEPVRESKTFVWSTRLATSMAALMLVALLLGDAFNVLSQAGQVARVLEDTTQQRAEPPATALMTTPAPAPAAPAKVPEPEVMPAPASELPESPEAAVPVREPGQAVAAAEEPPSMPAPLETRMAEPEVVGTPAPPAALAAAPAPPRETPTVTIVSRAALRAAPVAAPQVLAPVPAVMPAAAAPTPTTEPARASREMVPTIEVATPLALGLLKAGSPVGPTPTPEATSAMSAPQAETGAIEAEEGPPTEAPAPRDEMTAAQLETVEPPAPVPSPPRASSALPEAPVSRGEASRQVNVVPTLIPTVSPAIAPQVIPTPAPASSYTGVRLPLWQLEVTAALLFTVLSLTTVWTARRRSGVSRWT